MPRRMTGIKDGTQQVLKNIAFESRVIYWLMSDGWQVFTPVLDNAHHTDILISDGPNFYRIQVKTIKASGEAHNVENRWKENPIDVVIFFASNSNWGYITPGFTEDHRLLNAAGHIRFEQTKNDFLKAFHKLEI